MRVVNRPTVGAFCDNTMTVHRDMHPTLAAAIHPTAVHSSTKSMQKATHSPSLCRFFSMTL